MCQRDTKYDATGSARQGAHAVKLSESVRSGRRDPSLAPGEVPQSAHGTLGDLFGFTTQRDLSVGQEARKPQGSDSWLKLAIEIDPPGAISSQTASISHGPS